jgi:coenzyme F420-reducing hydrogenase alpha subunit
MAQEAATEAGLGDQCLNPYKSIIVRSVETLYACDEALRILETVPRPEQPSVAVEVREGTGYAITEAPRGILYHRYQINAEGEIEQAQIVPPTSQNQKSIESDLRELVQQNISLREDELQHRCEHTIRHYDPCISCATHFLKLHVNRGAGAEQ